jgi:hypothetical protein
MIDTVIRWYAAASAAVVAPVIGGLLENLSVLSPVEDLAERCELPLLTSAIWPNVAYATEAGFAVAATSLLALAVSFKLATTEVVRYRALTIVSLLTWVAVLVGSLQVLLALFVFPVARCG